MGARLVRALVASLTLAASAAFGDASAGGALDAIARLEAALRAHPEDAALARALARAQLEAGLTDAALATLDAHSALRPEQRSALAQLRGRALYARGELELARSALREAIAHRETDALAHLFLGLTEHRLGNRAAAAEALARAQQLDPRLGERVRAAAASPPSGWRGVAERFSLFGRSSLEYDTNSTLEGEESSNAILGGPSDSRLAHQVGLAARVLARDEAALSLAYHFDENHHLEHDELDVRGHHATLSARYAFAPRWMLRLDGGASLLRLDGAPYLDVANLATGLAWRSESHGTFELRATGTRMRYDEAPSLPSLERDGWRAGAGLRHALRLRWGLPASLATQIGYARRLTEGRRDEAGFGPAYDSHYASVDTTLRVELPHELRVSTRLGLSLERFDHRNVNDAQGARRHDRVIDANLALARPLTEWLELEAHLRETRRFSNVELYDWDRQIVGMTLRFFWQPIASRRKP
jgi:tetratricopeptide (TPR) repeat protein